MNKATRTVVLAFGLVMAIAGFEHGLGELSQGNAGVNGLFIKSWGESELFSVLEGEPALTVLPNMLASGISTILVSVAIAAWCLFFLKRRHSGPVLLSLSLILLLVGGGFAPPLMGILLGLAATKLNSDFPTLRKAATKPFLRALSRIWPYSLTLGLLCYIYLIPVTLALWGIFGYREIATTIVGGLFAYAMILVSTFTAHLHDAIGLAEGERVRP